MGAFAKIETLTNTEETYQTLQVESSAHFFFVFRIVDTQLSFDDGLAAFAVASAHFLFVFRIVDTQLSFDLNLAADARFYTRESRVVYRGSICRCVARMSPGDICRKRQYGLTT